MPSVLFLFFHLEDVYIRKFIALSWDEISRRDHVEMVFSIKKDISDYMLKLSRPC